MKNDRFVSGELSTRIAPFKVCKFSNADLSLVIETLEFLVNVMNPHTTPHSDGQELIVLVVISEALNQHLESEKLLFSKIFPITTYHMKLLQKVVENQH